MNEIKLNSLSSTTFKAINLACGGKLCNSPGWINADHNPSNNEVMKVNLLKPLPFKNNTFDIVYHSQFIEHLPMDQAANFLKECYRVLKPNGILRVVTPDLQDQATEYLKTLHGVMKDPNEEAKLKYDWMRLEMLDQLTRQKAGGDMVSYMSNFGIKAQNYLHERLGVSGDNMIPPSELNAELSKLMLFKTYLRKIRNSARGIAQKFIPHSCVVGRFRLSGEVHLCMFDEYLLSSLLIECDFSNISRVSAKDSQIENWNETNLDSDKDGNLDCPASLFIEAVKVVS